MKTYIICQHLLRVFTTTILIHYLNNEKFLDSTPCFQNGLEVSHSIFDLVCFLAATLFLLYLLWFNCFWKLSSLFKFILNLIEAMRLIYFVLGGHLTDFFLLCPVCKYIQIHWGSTFGYLLKNSFLFSHPWSVVTSLNDKFACVNCVQVMFSKWMKTNQKIVSQICFSFF